LHFAHFLAGYHACQEKCDEQQDTRHYHRSLHNDLLHKCLIIDLIIVCRTSKQPAWDRVPGRRSPP
jgi:hypothetical protein